MTQVFVSYARKDLGAALIEAIGQTGLNIWHPGAISSEGSFEEQVRRELESAQCVVVLWSNAAAQSRFVQQEIHQALQAWSSDRLVLAALDDAPLPLGLRDRPAYRRLTVGRLFSSLLSLRCVRSNFRYWHRAFGELRPRQGGASVGVTTQLCLDRVSREETRIYGRA